MYSRSDAPFTVSSDPSRPPDTANHRGQLPGQIQGILSGVPALVPHGDEIAQVTRTEIKEEWGSSRIAQESLRAKTLNPR